MRVCGISINGGLTGYGVTTIPSYEVAKPYRSEINANNSWNVNFNDGNVNNNNNKYNDNYVRPCTANVEYQIILQTICEAYEDCLKGKRAVHRHWSICLRRLRTCLCWPGRCTR